MRTLSVRGRAVGRLELGRWLLPLVLGLGLVGCGTNTDKDRDGFFAAAELEGLYLYDCDDSDPLTTFGEIYFRDDDGDGLGNRLEVCYICLGGAETPAPAADRFEDVPVACVPDGKSPKGGFVHNSLDCDDTLEGKNFGRWFYRDLDEDGYGDPNPALARYECPESGDDEPPEGYVVNNIDCDDGDKASEGSTTGFAKEYHLDSDGDGFGGSEAFLTCLEPPETGYVLISETLPLDCDDSNQAVRPFLDYDCSLGQYKDDDCDGQAGEDIGRLSYKDADEDLWGDPYTEPSSDCPPPPGWVYRSGDCNDEDEAVYPGVEDCVLP